MDTLAEGLKNLKPDSTKFDLLVLSTCYNGTPHTISLLAPFACCIIASPENLHLSYFDLQPLEHLEISLHEGDLSIFAKQFARQTFERLAQEVQTAVTVAVYDVDRVQLYLQSVASAYDSALTTLKKESPTSLEHCDCAEDSAYVRPG
jgi:hypothetical protein